MEIKNIHLNTKESKLNFIVNLNEEELKPFYTRAYQRLATTAHLPGFRKGHLPLDIIKLYLKPRVDELVLQEALNLINKEIWDKESLIEYKPVNRPEFKICNYSESNLEVEITAEIEPKLEINDYLEIELEKEPISPPDAEEIENHLKKLQKEYAIFHPVDEEGSYQVREGTLVELQINSYRLGKLWSSQRKEVRIGALQLPQEIEEKIIGMKRHEQKRFFTKVPSNLHSSAFGGEEIEVEITILNLWKEELIELNDEFAKEVGDFNSLDELKENIRKSLIKEREEKENTRLKDILLKKLVDKYDFHIPNCLIERELQYLLLSLSYNLSTLGLTQEAYLYYRNMKEEELKEELRKSAEFRTKAAIILENIASKEKIEANEEELEEFIKAAFSSSLAKRSLVEERPIYKEALKRELIYSKTLNFLLQRVKMR
jgi:trigger factor